MEPGDGLKAVSAGIAIEAIDVNPFQPRRGKSNEKSTELLESIRRNGVLQPIIVRRKGERFQIIAGERRFTAARALGMGEIPAVVREASDEQMLELALIENLQREDLNAIDRAIAYRQFCDRFRLKPEEVGERLGEDRSTVVNYLRLLDLPEWIQELVAAGRLSMGHARSLLSVIDVALQERLVRWTLDEGVSVRALEEAVRGSRGGPATEGRGSPEARTSPHVEDLQRRFEEALKTKVRIHEGRRRGSGRLVIEYYSLDDFDRIAELLGVRLDESSLQ